jgi:pimeloyl-ACP methyl ester carboxylesterase
MREVPRLIPPARAEGYVNSFDGTPIFWELHGPKPDDPAALRPMVFCYGLVCSINQWRQQIERYSPKHPCLLLDYRGHHKSGRPINASAFNLSALAKDVSAAIEGTFGRQASHVWGHSMGCSVALELALADPDLVHSLVLCCGTPDNPFRGMLGSELPEHFSRPFLDLVDRHPGPFFKAWDLFRARTEITVAVAWLAGFNQATVSREDIVTYAEAVCSVESETFFTLLRELAKGMTRAILPRVKVPAIVIAGGMDRVTPPHEQKAMAELLPDGIYVEIPAGSHNVQLDFGEYVGLKVESIWRERNLL